MELIETTELDSETESRSDMTDWLVNEMEMIIALRETSHVIRVLDVHRRE